MESKIKSVLNILRVEYIAIWVISAATIMAYETDLMAQGVMIGNAKAEYIAQLVGILLAICLVPMSLRMFSLSVTKYVKSKPLEPALKSYRRWSEIRLTLLLVVMVFNISLYYWTLNNTGLLCAGMAAIAALFCVPGRKRLMSELDMLKPEEDNC